MPDLSIELTNVCNRDCIHCLRDKLETREYMEFDLFQEIINQTEYVGIDHISLTGGEPTLNPNWQNMLTFLSERKKKFSLVSNGYKFRENSLQVLLEPTIKKHISSICFSLDGASSRTHDHIRGQNSFNEVIEAANLCKLKGIPTSFKTIVSSINKEELLDIALLGSTLGANQHSFLSLVPTPQLILNDLIPTLDETKKLYAYVTGDLFQSLRTEIIVEGSWGVDDSFFTCNALQQSFAIDHLGNLIFCCNLSHICNGNKPSKLGREFLIHIRDEGLIEGVIRHYQLAYQFVKDRFNSSRIDRYPCLWCMNYFNKLEWIKEFPSSKNIKEFLSIL